MKPDNPVLFIKIDKDITNYLNGAYLGGGSVVFLIALDDVAKLNRVQMFSKRFFWKSTT